MLKSYKTRNSISILRLVIFIIFISLISVVYFTTTKDMQVRKETILQQQIINLDNTYKVSMNRFEVISSGFNSTVVNRKDILELLYKAKHTNDNLALNLIRKELFKKIKPHFDRLKKLGVIITLFASENNKTLLRMHKPNKFNDNLSEVRYSFKYANANKKRISGLEEGKIMHAFRNIYPIYYNGEYLGSVDIAFSSEVLEQHMEKLYKTDTHFIINKSVFMTNIWKMKDMVNYTKSIEHENFLHNTNDSNLKKHFVDIEMDLNYKLKNDIYKNIKHEKAFALEESGHIIAFLPVENIKDKKTIAYLVSYIDNDYLKEVVQKYIWINIFSLIVSLVISLLVYKNIKSRLLLNKNLEKEVEDQNKAFEIIFDKASDGIIILEDNKITQCNEAIIHMLKLKTKKQLIGKLLSDIAPQYQENSVLSIDKYAQQILVATKHGVNNFEWKLIKADGKEFWTGMTLTVIIISGKKIIHVLIRDITSQKEKEKSLEDEKMILSYKANHDVLTMLPNRSLFNDRLTQSINAASRYEQSFAIMFIDLDEFKPINDNLGHMVGDKVLQEVASRLKNLIRAEDTLSRFGGDEFVILMQNIKESSDVSILADKVINELSRTIKIDEKIIQISASVGISLYPENTLDSKELLRYADIAMYKAKSEGKNNFQFYTL